MVEPLTSYALFEQSLCKKSVTETKLSFAKLKPQLLFFQNTINISIHFLIIKAYMSLNSSRLCSRILIPPDVIRIFLPIDRHIVVLCQPFVWTLSGCLAWGEIFPFNLFSFHD